MTKLFNERKQLPRETSRYRKSSGTDGRDISKNYVIEHADWACVRHSHEPFHLSCFLLYCTCEHTPVSGTRIVIPFPSPARRSTLCVPLLQGALEYFHPFLETLKQLPWVRPIIFHRLITTLRVCIMVIRLAHLSVQYLANCLIADLTLQAKLASPGHQLILYYWSQMAVS